MIIAKILNQIFFVRICRSFLFMLVTVCIIFAFSGCGLIGKDFNRAPEFSDVRTNLGHDKANDPTYYLQRPSESKYSLYRTGVPSFYRDPRAMRPGDVLTVLISMNDRANLNNKSDLKRNSDSGYLLGSDLGKIFRAGGNVKTASKLNSKGDAKVERREDIRLSVAAVVTAVLPNGNLLINGSQEVRVNYELRVLNIVGIVRPRDIAGNNTINYDKIAEARISYGGRGRMSDVQQPPYGQQFLNRVSPF
ncbi:MAG: flagellar L-ring protein precursor FlgH [Candidatus Tokpelaia sp. JSC188]|nr:MAG: flagellar L-ring protein precursor FlgH [Candidatus Tokpelaia sp. JSC188]